MTNYEKIGNYTEATDDTPEVIERDFFGQGMIFKDEEAFYNHYDKPCYIPELSDAVYTKQDFIDLCGGREDFAEVCFETVDWQHPDTWIEEQFTSGEWDECPACKRFYDRYDKPEPCSKCGGPLEYEIGTVSRDDITKVEPDKLRHIIDTREPLGLFYALADGTYTGVDNRDGNAWTEAFSTLRRCKRWLLDVHLTAGGRRRMSGIFFDGKWHESTDMKCNRCGSPVFESDLLEYTYQCFKCDEDLYDFEVEEQDAHYFPRVIVARRLDGITINTALEYLLDDSGEPRIFDSQTEAEAFLVSNGIPAEDMDHFFFVECDNGPEEPDDSDDSDQVEDECEVGQ
jgi:uncharacterized protein (DUF983 family)